MSGLNRSERPSRAVKYASDFRAAFDVSERTFRNWRAAKIIPEPDGNILGRDFWLPATYEQTQNELLSGRHARLRRPPRLRDTKPAA